MKKLQELQNDRKQILASIDLSQEEKDAIIKEIDDQIKELGIKTPSKQDKIPKKVAKKTPKTTPPRQDKTPTQNTTGTDYIRLSRTDGVEQCKAIIKGYNAKVKKAKIEELRKALIAQSPNEKEEILAAPDEDIERKMKPKPRLDTLSKQKIKALVSFNFSKRLKKDLSKEAKTEIEGKFEQISKRIYELLEDEIQKLLK